MLHVDVSLHKTISNLFSRFTFTANTSLCVVPYMGIFFSVILYPTQIFSNMISTVIFLYHLLVVFKKACVFVFCFMHACRQVYVCDVDAHARVLMQKQVCQCVCVGRWDGDSMHKNAHICMCVTVCVQACMFAGKYM